MCFNCVTEGSVELRFSAGSNPEFMRYPGPRDPDALGYPAETMLYPFWLFVDDDIAAAIRYSNGCTSSAEISKIVICRIVSRFLAEGFDAHLWEELVSLCGKEALREEIESPLPATLNLNLGRFWSMQFTYDHISSQEFWNDLRKPDDVLLRHCEEMLVSLLEFRDWYYLSDREDAHMEMFFDYKMFGGYPAPICFFALQYIYQYSGSVDLLHAFAEKPDDKPYFISQYGMWAVFLMKSFELLVKRLGFRPACERCARVAVQCFLNALSLPTTTLTDVRGAIEFLKTQVQPHLYHTLGPEFPKNELEILETLEASYLENKTPYRPFLPPLSSK